MMDVSFGVIYKKRPPVPLLTSIMVAAEASRGYGRMAAMAYMQGNKKSPIMSSESDAHGMDVP